MSKKDEALRLALEALAVKFSEGWHEGIKIDASDIMLLNDAAQALAEQPAQQDPSAGTQVSKVWWDGEKLMEKQVPLEDFYKPAQQEPVAWRDPKNVDPGQGCTYDKAKHEKWPHIYTQPLYTSPPAQRTWVGLTDEDKHYLNDVLNLQGRFPVIDAIEAKLREKNNG